MAVDTKTIGQLNPRTSPLGTDLFELQASDGLSYHISLTEIAAAIGSGSGHIIEDEGTPLTQRTSLNFVGPNVTVTDDAGNDASVVTISGGAAALDDLTDVTITTQAIGDILVADSSSTWINYAATTSGFVLTSNGPGTQPTWQAAAGGTSFIGFTADADLSMGAFNVIFPTNGSATLTSTMEIYRTAATLNLNADAGDAIIMRAGGAEMMSLGNGAVPSLQMTVASIQQAVGTPVASTGSMSLVRDGNYYHVTGTTTINTISNAGWQNGSTIDLYFEGIVTVTDAATGAGEIHLANNSNYTSAAGEVLTLVLDAGDWVEISRSAVSAGGGGLNTNLSNIDAVTALSVALDLNTQNITDMGVINFVSKGDPGNSNSISYVTDTVYFRNSDNAGFEFWFGADGTPKYIIDSNGINMSTRSLYGPQRITGTDLLRIITFETTASAVNYFNIKGSIAGQGVTLETEGSDTNIDMILTPKGNLDGSVLINSRALKMIETTTKTAPTAGRAKFYPKDVGGRSHLFIQDDVGEVDLNLGAPISFIGFTADADLDMAGFNIEFKTATPITIGQGATDVLSVTFRDDVVDAGVLIGNTDGFVSFTNESAVVGDNQMALTMEAGGATTIQNVMRFQVPVADDTGTTPILRIDIVDDAGGAAGRPLLQLTSAATEYLEIDNSTDWNFHVSTTLKDLQNIIFRDVQNTDVSPGTFTGNVIEIAENYAIAWDGAVAANANAIGFTTSDAFQVIVGGTVEFQVLAAQVDFSQNPITGAGSIAFLNGNSTVDGDATGIIIDSITSTDIQVNGVSKYTFGTTFLTGAAATFLQGFGGIYSANTDELLIFNDVGSAAVNHLEIDNALTGVGPLISVDGEAHVDLRFASKGTDGVINMLDYLVLDTNLQLFKQVAAVSIPAGNNIAPREGNVFDVSNGATNNLGFIVDELFWQNGSTITLEFTADTTVVHNQATPPANYAPILLEGAVDATMLTGDTITVYFDGTSWIETARQSLATPGLVMEDATDIVIATGTGTEIGTGATQKIGFWGATPVVQPTGAGADLTNNVTVGGTSNTIADYTDLTTYATDAAAIRNNIHQLARSLKFLQDSLRLMGLQSLT